MNNIYKQSLLTYKGLANATGDAALGQALMDGCCKLAKLVKNAVVASFAFLASSFQLLYDQYQLTCKIDHHMDVMNVNLKYYKNNKAGDNNFLGLTNKHSVTYSGFMKNNRQDFNEHSDQATKYSKKLLPYFQKGYEERITNLQTRMQHLSQT